MPVLSICTPSYNREALALELLGELDQPGLLPFEFEVVLVDNGSSDSSYESVRTFAPQHYTLRYVRLDRTISVFANVLGSLRRAVGSFCMYLADDDRLVPAVLADIIGVMRQQPSLVATYAGWEYTDLVERRVLFPGAQLEETTFEAASAQLPLAGLVRRRVIPEIGVYRTDSLAKCLLPSRLFYWPYIHVVRQLMVGSVRLSARAFYQYTWRRAGEPYPRPTVSRQMAFEHWESMNRGLDLWARYLPAAWGPAPTDSALQSAKVASLELAFGAALMAGRHLEAFEIGLLLQSEGRAKLDLDGATLDNLHLAAALEAIHEIWQTTPGLAGLCLEGLEAPQRARLAEVVGALGGDRPLVPVSAQDVPPAAHPGYLVLTLRDFQRAPFLARGCPPGLVFSLEGLLRIFHL